MFHWVVSKAGALPLRGGGGKLGQFSTPTDHLDFSSFFSGLPENVQLEPLPRWILVGQNFILRCQVWGGKPRQNLTMALLRGPQELSRQAVSEQDLGKAAEVTFTATASREDHGANFSCRAELDLRAQGLGPYQKSSTPKELHTFGEGQKGLLDHAKACDTLLYRPACLNCLSLCSLLSSKHWGPLDSQYPSSWRWGRRRP